MSILGINFLVFLIRIFFHHTVATVKLTSKRIVGFELGTWEIFFYLMVSLILAQYISNPNKKILLILVLIVSAILLVLHFIAMLSRPEIAVVFSNCCFPK